jgi:D-alanyl-D-alanine-carboxypeptidase/D-alanyl-D-alanine-endopeptidase
VKVIVQVARHIWRVGLLAVVLTAAAHSQTTQESGRISLPSDAEIHQLLTARVQALAGQQDGIGIVVGIVGPQGRRIISYGHIDQNDSRLVDGDTQFEIGSITKVFTALLLADMVRTHEIALDDPVAKYVPPDDKIPQPNGRPITLVDLATHTSGLPFMPAESPTPNGFDNPNHDTAQFYRFLAQYNPTRGTGWDYSNLGYWLLSECLASRGGMEYESLLRTRVLVPLKLTSTTFTPSPKTKADLAVGHNAVLQPSQPFASAPAYGSMAAAGGLVSSVNDLLTFLSATMGYEDSPLTPAMAVMLNTRRPIGEPGEEQALGWRISGHGDDALIFHDGATWGFASDMAWDPRIRVGIVVLSNQLEDVSDIARHLLRPEFPLAKPVPMIRRTEIEVAPALLDSYVGQYQVAGEGTFDVARTGEFLTIRFPDDWGLPQLRLHPDAIADFFSTELLLRVRFQTSTDGRVTGLLLDPPRGQHTIVANRVGKRNADLR